MEHSDGLICNIARKLKEAALRTEKEIMNLFPPLLAYELLTGCQRYISHDFDPPWDSSGFLFSKSSDASFDIGVYKKVGDFFVNYTGNSEATYTSGCGLYHETYGEHYEEWMEEQYRNAHYSVLHMTIEFESVTTIFESELLITKVVSFSLKKVLIGTITAPILFKPIHVYINSIQFGRNNATLSPFLIPNFLNAFATLPEFLFKVVNDTFSFL